MTASHGMSSDKQRVARAYASLPPRSLPSVDTACLGDTLDIFRTKAQALGAGHRAQPPLSTTHQPSPISWKVVLFGHTKDYFRSRYQQIQASLPFKQPASKRRPCRACHSSSGGYEEPMANALFVPKTLNNNTEVRYTHPSALYPNQLNSPPTRPPLPMAITRYSSARSTSLAPSEDSEMYWENSDDHRLSPSPAPNTSFAGRGMDPRIIPGNHWSTCRTLLNVLKTSRRNTRRFLGRLHTDRSGSSQTRTCGARSGVNRETRGGFHPEGG
jgi:hypothetical protein